jgi:stringent starvation protein B
MVSTKPYLIRAIYEWCADQGFTPYLAAQVDEHTRVPSGYVRDGQIVLNIGADATHQLVMDNECVSFQARFNGVAHHIVVPVDNVAAIYARENGQGMAFEVQLTSEVSVTAETSDVSDDDDERPPTPPRGSHLKVIK